MKTMNKFEISRILRETSRRLLEAGDEDDSLDDLGGDEAPADDAGGDGAAAPEDDAAPAPANDSADQPPELASDNEQGDSLDSQVDHYLMTYEKEAKNMKNEGFDFRQIQRRLLEADSDPNANAITAAGGTGTSAGQDAGLDVTTFANDVVRLINNYDSLLEVRDTLVKRAVNFLAKGGQSDDVIEQFKEVLRSEHGMEVGKTRGEVEDEYQAPPAIGAGVGQ